MHGANRLGGNGVANSTVFGGIAGDTMAAWVPAHGRWRDADEAAIAASIAAHDAPFAQPPKSLEPIREALYDCMWQDVGILRTGRRPGARARSRSPSSSASSAQSGVADGDRTFNLTWHDWLNLRNLIAVSRVIARSALAREDSRGAHFREDFPTSGDLEASSAIVVRARGDGLALDRQPVRFTRVRPGQTLLEPAPAGAG